MNYDYNGDGFLQDVYETALLALGGRRPVDDAHEEAAAFVDQAVPVGRPG